MQPIGQLQGDMGALREAFQRRTQGQGGGQPAGQPQGGQPMPTQGGGAPQPLQPQQNMSQTGIDQLQKSQPNEAQLILRALIQRLRKLGEQGQ